MRRRGIQIVVAFLAVFAVIPFVPRETKQTFFQDRIAAVPHRDRKTDALMPIRNAGDAVLVPEISFRGGMIWRKMLPCRAARAVVFANCTPSTLAEIRPPALPVRRSVARFFQALLFGVHRYSPDDQAVRNSG